MSNRKLVIRAALAMVAGLGIATSSWGAGSLSPTLQVKSTVVQNCTADTTGDVVFGNYDPVSANTTGNNLYATGSVAVKCTKGSPSVTIDLDVGSTGLSGNFRQMHDSVSGNNLQYQLYKTGDSPGTTCSGTGAETVIWGSGLTGGAKVTPSAGTWTSAGTLNTFNICGVLLGGQDVSVGSYSDTVTATIAF